MEWVSRIRIYLMPWIDNGVWFDTCSMRIVHLVKITHLKASRKYHRSATRRTTPTQLHARKVTCNTHISYAHTHTHTRMQSHLCFEGVGRLHSHGFVSVDLIRCMVRINFSGDVDVCDCMLHRCVCVCVRARGTERCKVICVAKREATMIRRWDASLHTCKLLQQPTVVCFPWANRTRS